MHSSTTTPVSLAARPRAWRKVGAVLTAVAVLTAAHALTSAHHAGLHALYEYLYYVPILAAAYWFGPWGGLLCAFAVTLGYVPHIRITWADNPAYAASQYGQLLAFHLVGGLVGLLLARERRAADEARSSAHALHVKNRELVASHQQLDHAERLSSLGQLAAGLAHEVRTPVTAIQGALDILAARAPSETPEAEFTAVASRELTRLSTLLEEFLAYARPRPPALVPTQLADIARHVVSVLQSEVRQRGVALTAEYATEGLVSGDPSQLTQVLLNLVLNAMQASPRGALVHVRVTEASDATIVEIADQGKGIPPDVLPRVFEPFFTTRPRGSGLGLAVAHRIVTAHGGTITLAPGTPAGTVATLRLPRPVPAQPRRK